jgi:hypothetical protein
MADSARSAGMAHSANAPMFTSPASIDGAGTATAAATCDASSLRSVRHAQPFNIVLVSSEAQL